MNLEWLNKHKYEIAAFLLFVLAWGLRANIDGLPLTYPGNIKAADPMYHTLAADIIVESGKYGNLAPYLAQGQTNLVDPSPPLNYLATAAIANVSGLPVWVVMYLLVTLFEAFGVIILFLLCRKIFDSEQVGLLAAALYVLPFGLEDWWYGMYIGLWNNVGGFFFFYASLWLAYEYWNKPARWTAFALSLTVAGTWLIHVAELFITAFAFGFVGLKVLFAVKGLGEKAKHLLLLGGIPLLTVILFWPRYQELSGFLTAGSGGTGTFFGWYAPQIASLPFYTSLSNFPWFILGFAGLGLIQICLNWRKYLPLLTGEAYLFCHLFVFPWAMSAYYFFVRQRMALPFIIAPLVAYGVYTLIIKPLRKLRIHEDILLLVIICIVIASAMPSYLAVSKIKYSEALDEGRYAALIWIQENTLPSAEFFFVNGFAQMGNAYAKRVAFDLDTPDFIPVLEQTLNSQGQIILTEFNRVGSVGNTEMGLSALDTGSFFKYDHGTKRSTTQNITTFDYVVVGDVHYAPVEPIRAYNQLLANHLIESYGWTPVYFENSIAILKNPKGDS